MVTNDFRFNIFKRLKIRTKLLSITSLIIISALAVMIIFATILFKSDMDAKIRQNNSKIAEVIAQKVESELYAIAEKLNLMGTTAMQEFRSTEQKSLFTNLFFTNDRNIIYIAVAEKSQNGSEITAVKSIANEEYLYDNKLSDSSLSEILKQNSANFLKAFNGDLFVFNVSGNFKAPVLAMVFPFKRNQNGQTTQIAIGYIRLEKFLKSFTQKDDIVETFMVNGDGDVLAHPNPQIVLTHGNFITVPIVQEMMKSKSDNGQFRYKDAQGISYLGSFKKTGFSGIGVIATAEEKKAFAAVYQIQKRNIFMTIITLTISILVIYFFAKTITNPIHRLLGATKEIEAGNFRVDIKSTTGDEIGQLTKSFVEMGAGLEEREKVKNILGNMVDPVVVEEAMKDLTALKQGSEKQITAFFSDVASFSTISEKLQSADLAALLNEYLSAMTIILKQYDGVLDKYIGDAIVGIFNAPVDVENHHVKACLASLDMIKKLQELREFWTRNNLYIQEAQQMDIRIGLNTGAAKVGFMGTDALASYTMMGDTVNLAARLEAAGKDYGVNILISEMVKNTAHHACWFRQLDLVRVKGKNEPVKIYELICRKEEADQHVIDATSLYEAGFKLYLDRNFDAAIAKFTESERVKGKKDKSAKVLIERCEQYKTNPPPVVWDGVFTRTHK